MSRTPPTDTASPLVTTGSGSYDLFLSYNSRDREDVQAVRLLLASRNVKTFYDRQDLLVGEMWLDKLQSAVVGSRAVAVFIGPGGLGTWQKREMALALDRQAKAEREGERFLVIPVLLPQSDVRDAPSLLLLNSWLDLRRRPDDPDALDTLARAVLGEAEIPPPAAPPLPPYRDLRAFREEDAPLFFGRETFARELLDKAKANDLVAVVGPSGSGKSSVVQAGLLPLLRREPPPFSGWDAVIFTPGANPFHNLALPLVSLWKKGAERTSLVVEAGALGNSWAGGAPLEVAVNEALGASEGTERLLVVADQFEELFTLAPEKLRRPFVEALLAAARLRQVTVLITLRADFYGQAIAQSRELSDLIQRGLVNLGPMKREELQLSIEQPARHVGLHFESGLVKRILDHVENQPGSLPLLEFALTELWLGRDGALLTNERYEQVGGVEGAVSRRADEQFGLLASDAERAGLLRFLTRLVRVSAAGEEGADTRRRASLRGLDEKTREAVESFARARLLVKGRGKAADEETVEVAHEAIIRKWPRLRELLDEDREFLLWRQRLRLRLDEYERTGRDAGALLGGALLAEAVKFLRERSDDLDAAERDYIEAGERAERERLERERSAQEQAERERVARERASGWLRFAAAALLLVPVALIGWRVWQRTDRYQIQAIRRDAADRVAYANSDAVTSWLLALALSGDVDGLRNAIAVAPGPHASALAATATALLKVGRADDARRVADQALAAARDEGTAQARAEGYLDSAEVLLKLGDKGRAGQAALEALSTDKQARAGGDAQQEAGANPVHDNRPRLVELLLKTDHEGEAHDILDEAKNPSFYYLACLDLIKLKKFDAARTLAERLLEFQTRIPALGALAKELKRSGRSDDAARAAREAADLAEVVPRIYRAEAFATAAEALLETGDEAGARRAAQKAYAAVKADENDLLKQPSLLLRAAAVTLARAGMVNDALVALHESFAADITPDFTAYASVAGALETAGRHDDAKRVVADALAQKQLTASRTDPKSLTIFLKIVSEQKGADRALNLLRQIDNPLPYYLPLSRAFLDAREPKEALAVAREALFVESRADTIDESTATLFRRVADLYVKSEQPDEFEDAVGEVSADHAVRCLMLAMLAESLAAHGKAGEAKDTLDVAASEAEYGKDRRDSSGKAFILSRLARVRARLGLFREAMVTASDCSAEDKLGVYAVAVVRYADAGDGKLLSAFDSAQGGGDESGGDEP
jgi:TIR domain